MDRPELADDSRFVDMKSRSLNMDLLDDLITDGRRNYRKKKFLKSTRTRRICAPVQGLADVVSDPHMHQRGSLHWTSNEMLGEMVLMSTPLGLGQSPPPLKAVPDLGQDTSDVLEEMLDSSKEIEELREVEAI